MKTLILIFLFLPIISFSQKETNFFECDFPIEKVNDSTYKIIVANFDSLHAAETCFLGWMNTGRSKPNGILYVYDENGVKRRNAIYRSGIRVGTHLMWYSTGELESETTWESDKYFTEKAYYKSGKIKFTAENGNRDNAVYKTYYENGQLEHLDDLSGEKTWYENGTPKTDRNTNSNEYKEWFINGQLKVKGELQNGCTRIGKWKYFNEKGKLIKKEKYLSPTRAELLKNNE
ncbi:MAG: hypothetical protein V2A54_16810 [Bacteroidota bacterium]